MELTSWILLFIAVVFLLINGIVIYIVLREAK